MRKRIILLAVMLLAASLLCACGPCKVHEFGEWETVQAATCTAEGTQVRHCINCDATEEAYIPVADHVMGDWSTEQEANCTEAGLQKRTCQNCSFAEQQELPPTGHSFGDWTVLEDPTCVDSGMNTRSCTRCGQGETLVTPALGHSYEAFLCSVCLEEQYVFCDAGTFYEGLDGLNVKIIAFQKTEFEGYYLYRLTYTLKNEVPDSATCEGIFRLHMADGSFEPQYGFFNDLFYKESRNFIYEWKILKTQEPVLLEYVPFDMGYEKTILEDSLHWMVP